MVQSYQRPGVVTISGPESSLLKASLSNGRSSR
uniref:Uncharacterized protein n=1 Tax=Anguilla anguilla TaxID=7936 RepID=A0A0E9PJ47_ANGAN